MQRVTITIDDDLDAELNRFMKGRGYVNRSEAIRDLARAGLQQAALEVVHIDEHATLRRRARLYVRPRSA